MPAQRPLTIFLSYSREDVVFADQLAAALKAHGYNVALDREAISGGEDWQGRLAGLIREADTVVFVLSPASASSRVCAWEVAEAVQLGKRILPVVCRPLDGLSGPPLLAVLNRIFFYEEPRLPGSGFGTGLLSLVTALNVDLPWVREQTRLLTRAFDWEQSGRDPDRLLAGDDVERAKTWVASRPAESASPTDLHLAFISASEQGEIERIRVERQRLEEIRRAQAERADALTAREAAAQALSRRTTIGLASSGVLTAAAGVLAYWGVNAEHRFAVQRERTQKAERQSREAAIAHEAARTDIVGQFAAYAASPKQLGAEGPPGGNSPYTKEVLAQLADPSHSLYEACFSAHLTVQSTSLTGQRPFLSTDMNGDVYLRRQPAARARKALIVSVDRLRRAGDLYNVDNDARAWERFLDQCGFDVVRIANPDKEAFESAVYASAPVPRVQRGSLTPLRRENAGLAFPEPAGPNTLSMFVFAGFGLYNEGESYLMTSSADASSLADLPANMVSLSRVQDTLRRAAAASILVLDTNFPDLRSL